MKIAWRNIRKNKRRSFVTRLAIAIVFVAVNLFRDYTDNTYNGLRESAIRGEGLGHINIYKERWLEKGKTDPLRHMFTRKEYKKVIDLVEEDDAVILANARLHSYEVKPLNAQNYPDL